MTVLERLKAAGYDPAVSLFPDSIGNAGSMECERIQIRTFFCRPREFLSTPSARRATAKTETKSLFSYKLYNILHEFRRALIYNGSKNYPNHAK